MKVRAALFYEPGRPLEVRDIDCELPGERDVLVRIQATGLCGSDLHVVRGEWPRPTPMVLGHEGAGIVESIGRQVTGLSPGDHVILSWAAPCGACVACCLGFTNRCIRVREAISAGTLLDGTTGLSVDGGRVFRMTTLGAFADLVVVPAAATLRVPREMPLDEAALLGCAALTGVGAVQNAAQVQPGTTVIVIGAGGVGQFCVQGARIAGAGGILVIDPVAARREMALTLGATWALDPADKAEIRDWVGDGADYVIDAVGSAPTSEAAIRLARPGGRVVLVGMPETGARLTIDPSEFTQREKILTGSVYGSQDPAEGLRVLLGLIDSGRLQLSHLLGPSFSLEAVNDAIAASLGGAAGRVLVVPAAQVESLPAEPAPATHA